MLNPSDSSHSFIIHLKLYIPQACIENFPYAKKCILNEYHFYLPECLVKIMPQICCFVVQCHICKPKRSSLLPMFTWIVSGKLNLWSSSPGPLTLSSGSFHHTHRKGEWSVIRCMALARHSRFPSFLSRWQQFKDFIKSILDVKIN